MRIYCIFERLILKQNSMGTSKKIRLLIALCFSLLLIHCSNDDNKEIKSEKYSDEVIELRDFLSAKMVVDLKNITYDSDKSAFIIDGDMIMSLENAREYYNRSNLKIADKANQMRTFMLMNLESSASIKVYIEPEVSPKWRIAVNEAIDNWNSLNSSITLTIVNIPASSNIKVNAWNGTVNESIASADTPNYKGQPGKFVTINAYYNNLDDSKKVNVMIHEFGHNFGLEHTNKTVGELIPCTPISDINSVMHSIAEDWISGFSYYDKVAISTLYSVATGTKKLYRYKKNQYYFYSADACEIVPDKEGYSFDGDAGYLYSTQILGTVPLYRSLNGTTIKDHKLSTIQKTSDDIILGYIYPNQTAGTIPLYSSTSSYENFPPLNHYLYTTKSNDDVKKIIIAGYLISK